MRISEAKMTVNSSGFSLVEIRRNPGKMEEYIAILYKHDGKSFLLAHENNSVVSTPDLEHVVLALKDIGFKKAEIYF